jgi:hypothetical protein
LYGLANLRDVLPRHKVFSPYAQLEVKHTCALQYLIPGKKKSRSTPGPKHCDTHSGDVEFWSPGKPCSVNQSTSHFEMLQGEVSPGFIAPRTFADGERPF